jgi:O-succinylbenzoic acid--CoA ligase
MLRCFTNRPKSVHSMLMSAVARRPEGIALVCDNEKVTYRELDRLVRRAAAGLAKRGVERGDRVLMLQDNSIEFVVVMYAVAQLGAISVPLNVRHAEPEVRHVVIDCGAKLVVYDSELADRIPHRSVAPTLEHRVAVHKGSPTPLSELLAPASGAAPREEQVAADLDDYDTPTDHGVAVNEEDTATILYTSGTTGRPKGAELTHLSIAHSVIHFTTIYGLDENDRCLLAVPMSHVTGVIALIDSMMYCAGTLIIMRSFKAADFIELAARHRMTYTLMVPAMFNLCLHAANFDKADLSAWRVAGYGGAIMPEVTVERLAQKLPRLKLFNTYGSTETTSPAVAMPPGEAVTRKEYVGLTVPCGHIVVMDEAGRQVAPNTPGEIYIGGAMVVPSYWNNPEATKREFLAGYWKSGDLGMMDEKGYLRVVDRIKDVINRGGFKIFASEVENVLLDHPAVIEAAVVAKPCPVLGERVHAFVVVRDDVADVDLTRHCATQLSDYKVPEAFYRVETTLPRNANGKVLKRELRQRLVA